MREVSGDRPFNTYHRDSPMSAPRANPVEETEGVREERGDRLFWDMSEEEGQNCEDWL